MSDPVTNVEIEDVLSSIRRLVSENGRAPAASKKAASAVIPDISISSPAAEPSVLDPATQESEVAEETAVPAPESAGAGRLVLTDALRVAKVPDSVEAEEIDTEQVPEAPFQEEPDVVALDKKLAEIEMASDSTTQGVARPEPIDTSVDMAEDVPAAPQAEVPEQDVHTPHAMSFVDAIKFRHIDIDEAQEASHNAMAKNNLRPWEIEDEKLSEWHSVRSDAPADYEPDEAGDSDYAGTQVAPLEWEDHSESAEITDKEPTEVDAPQTPHEGTTDTVEEPTTVVEAVAETTPEAEATPEQPQEAVLDEEMLRDLVGEIVRQELQGPLGERITRNVRKLVRREINRALAARSLNDL